MTEDREMREDEGVGEGDVGVEVRDDAVRAVVERHQREHLRLGGKRSEITFPAETFEFREDANRLLACTNDAVCGVSSGSGMRQRAAAMNSVKATNARRPRRAKRKSRAIVAAPAATGAHHMVSLGEILNVHSLCC